MANYSYVHLIADYVYSSACPWLVRTGILHERATGALQELNLIYCSQRLIRHGMPHRAYGTLLAPFPASFWTTGSSDEA